MTTRPTRRPLKLAQPFALKGAGNLQPAGPRQIETDEESLGAAVAPRDVATFIHIHRDGASQVVTLDADGLSELLVTGVMIPLDSIEPTSDRG